MDEKQDRNLQNEFMLEEYRYIQKLGLETIYRSERRVNLFFTIFSGFIAILVLAKSLNSISIENWGSIITVSLLLLLIFGIATTNRVVQDSKSRERYYQMMNWIREYFAMDNPQIGEFLIFQKKHFEGNNPDSQFVAWLVKFHRSSLTDIMILCNSFALGGIVISLLLSFGFRPNGIIILLSVASSVISIIAFRAYYKFILKSL